MPIAGIYIGQERRESSTEERKQHAMDTGKPEANGGVVISVSRRTVIALVLAVLGLGGGGTAVLQLLPTDEPQTRIVTRPTEAEIEEVVDRAIEKNATIAVLKANSENMKESLSELKHAIQRQERDRRH